MEETKFTWFPKLTDTVAKVPEELRGSLLWALVRYGTYGEEPDLGWPLDAIFESLREDIANSKQCRSNGKAGVGATKRRLRMKRNHPLAKPKPPFAKHQTPLWVMPKPPFARAERGLWKMPNPNQTKPVQSNPNQRW